MLTGLEFAEFLQGGFGGRITLVGGVVHAVAEGLGKFTNSRTLVSGKCRVGLNF